MFVFSSWRFKFESGGVRVQKQGGLSSEARELEFRKGMLEFSVLGASCYCEMLLWSVELRGIESDLRFVV